eukprot:TRINITY_DN914_c1_g3_i11.p2 TRINITY_DN914_c1_g3~~TRINITY_DN914_c1_g3_i11.p2  ORF type:complete len:261 (-),score=-13.57 TRINITY_DN914_c1_g3_i11:1003-1785(-)
MQKNINLQHILLLDKFYLYGTQFFFFFFCFFFFFFFSHYNILNNPAKQDTNKKGTTVRNRLLTRNNNSSFITLHILSKKHPINLTTLIFDNSRASPRTQYTHMHTRINQFIQLKRVVQQLATKMISSTHMRENFTYVTHIMSENHQENIILGQISQLFRTSTYMQKKRLNQSKKIILVHYILTYNAHKMSYVFYLCFINYRETQYLIVYGVLKNGGARNGQIRYIFAHTHSKFKVSSTVKTILKNLTMLLRKKFQQRKEK